jgi:hypothetical protein
MGGMRTEHAGHTSDVVGQELSGRPHEFGMRDTRPDRYSYVCPVEAPHGFGMGRPQSEPMEMAWAWLMVGARLQRGFCGPPPADLARGGLAGLGIGGEARTMSC